MLRSWSDFPVVEKAPDPATHRRLEDTTWDLCLMWTAGPAWIVATPDRMTREPVTVLTVGEDGSHAYDTVPFSPENQRDSDDALDVDLAVVGLPPRPRGFDWHLRLTPSQDRVFSDRYGDHVEDGLPGTTSTSEYLAHMYRRMGELVPEALTYATGEDHPID